MERKQKNDVEELAKSLKELTNRRNELVKKNPRVSNRYHKKATKSWDEFSKGRQPEEVEPEKSDNNEQTSNNKSVSEKVESQE